MGLKKSSKKAKSADHCAAKVMDAVPLVMRFIRADMRARNTAEMSVPQFRTLAFLDHNPGASLTELAEHLGVTRATASANTERLVQRNFITRCDHPDERRRIVLNLTDAGKQHLQKTRKQTRAYITELLNAFSEEEVSAIATGLTLLKQVFDPPDDQS